MKPIPQMLAELPPKPDPYALHEDLSTYISRQMFFLDRSVAVLKAAAEKRQASGHAALCGIHPRRCTCGYDDMQSVLEALK